MTVLIRPIGAITIPAVADVTAIKDESFILGLPIPSGGVPPYTYEITGITAGRGLSTSGRFILGTPTTAETYTVTYTVTDVYGDSGVH